eukprot:jgi/Botrbrau1/10122/Bobra.20_2s0028.1
MQAIIYENPGGPEVLRMGTVPVPVPGPTDVLLSVKAAGVNRAEAMQREGHYPRSPRAVSNIGPRGLRHHHSGRRGCGGLESGGSSHGSSEWRRLCRTGDGGRGLQCWRYPDNWSDAEAAGFMETTLTAFLNIFQIGGAKARSTVLIHGGASGVGTQAAALCKARDITTFVTCGSDVNCKKAVEAGQATFVLNYKTEDWVGTVAAHHNQDGGKGANVLLDCVGGPYLAHNLDCLAMEGRLMLIGLMGGGKVAEGFDVSIVLRKRAQIIGSTLRNRSTPFKRALVASLKEQFGAEIRDGRLKPRLDKVYPLADAADAHRRLDGRHFGKIVLSATPL